MAKPSFQATLANNVDVSVDGDVMTLRVNLTRDLGASASGKTRTVASTNGFFHVPTHPGVILALNVNKK